MKELERTLAIQASQAQVDAAICGRKYALEAVLREMNLEI
jgi:hypothetical protein